LAVYTAKTAGLKDDPMDDTTGQMGSGNVQDQQSQEAARKRQQQGQHPAQLTPQAGGSTTEGQMQATQFTDWASI
jgi:hypothetical protein